MWIMNQTKTKIVNADNIVGIYVNSGMTQVLCTVVNTEESVVLGNYKTVDECKEVVAAILLCVTNKKVNYICLPLAGSVDDWSKSVSTELTLIQ